MQTAHTKEEANTFRSAFIQHNTQHAHTILDEVLDRSPQVKWDDIAGLHVAKQILQVHVCANGTSLDYYRASLRYSARLG